MEDPSAPMPPRAAPAHTFRFWGIFIALCLLSFISALDVAIITTALPSITADIGGSKLYVWIANSFVLASSVFQPLFGQLANLFGRRKP
ncbi:major facilitator superfamily MFS_1 [Sclerotinia borealis F-4128]|uniref:Major facilitator superfamily MFS_1 n=1 Tax=Sclerotinia borealis (strain F-4128) TaxID=1432307 RepID=W9CDA5_SCLBF|nr:major facilitator superfamily MFS_1 [Sclerotinia borealis F-4128]